MASFRDRLVQRWLDHRFPPGQEIQLNHKHIFILPTGYGYLYLTICLLLFIGGVNYQNNLILGLTFLLVSLFLVAILHTFRNLLRLTVRNGGAESGFVGGQGSVQLLLFGHRGHNSIALQVPGETAQFVSVVAGEESGLWLNLPLPRRGKVMAPRLKLFSRYPLGLLQAWSYVRLEHFCLAWPAPQSSEQCPADGGQQSSAAVSSGQTGNDEFQGLRGYHPGDSLRKVDWKGYARGRGLNTKQFEEPSGGRLWLRWQHLQGLPEEQKLSILCHWVLQLDQQKQPYGLSLPGLTLSPDRGDAHRKRALDALASYPEFY